MMRRTLAALLLAATAAAPLTAQAQDWQQGRNNPQPRENPRDHGNGRGNRAEGQQQQRGNPGDGQRGRPERQPNVAPSQPVVSVPAANWQGRQPGGQRDPRDNRGVGRVENGTRWNGGNDQRDRQPGAGVAVGGPSGNWQNRQPDWQRNRPTNSVESGSRWTNRDNRGDRDNNQWGNRDDRRGPDRDRWDNRGGGRDNWNRDWRNDRRYDWQNYRYSNRNIYRVPRYYGRPGYDYRRWSPGYRMPDYYYGRSYWINDPWDYRLPPAYGPYRWVRYYDDVMLVDITNGLIEDIIYSFFYR